MYYSWKDNVVEWIAVAMLRHSIEFSIGDADNLFDVIIPNLKEELMAQKCNDNFDYKIKKDDSGYPYLAITATSNFWKNERINNENN